MILTCENCHARYLVPGHALGEGGRQVRCTNCGHEWYQEPDAEVQSAKPEDLEPIPESVRPVPDSSSVPSLPGEASESNRHLAEFAGYAAALLVFIAILGALVLAREPVMRMWPATAAFYQAIGYETPVPGESLIFEQLHAVSDVNDDGVQVIVIEGRIINLSSQDVTVPTLQASLRQDDGDIVEQWRFAPDQARLQGQGETTFRTVYPGIFDGVREVNVRFIAGR